MNVTLRDISAAFRMVADEIGNQAKLREEHESFLCDMQKNEPEKFDALHKRVLGDSDT